MFVTQHILLCTTSLMSPEDVSDGSERTITIPILHLPQTRQGNRLRLEPTVTEEYTTGT